MLAENFIPWEDLTPEAELLNFLELLHGDTDFKKGRIYVGHLENGSMKWQYNYSYEQLQEKIKNYIGNLDIYLTPNSFMFKGKKIYRDSDHIWQLRSLYVDLDTKKLYKAPQEAYEQVLNMIEHSEIPEPSAIVFSGRGLHIYWRIKDITRDLIPYWSSLQQSLINKLECFGSDDGAKDVARILRLPYTVNSRNMETCEIWYSNLSTRYTLQEIEEAYFPKTKKPKKRVKSKSNTQSNDVIKFPKLTKQSLYYTRAKDLEKLQELRGGEFLGQRNKTVFIYCNYLAQVKEYTELYKATYEFNKGFTEPLPIAEVNRVVKYVLKRKHEGKKYRFRNDTLIKYYNITPGEMEQLETIISKEEKQRRNTISKRKSRRGEDGLTDKQREREQKRKKAIELAAQGFTQRDISKMLNITQSTVSRLLK